MLFRRIEPNDLTGVLALYHQLHPDEELPSEESLRTVWPQLLTSPLVHLLVGELDGALVCTCTLVIVPNLTRQARPYALVENVVTDRAYRRQGIGTAILRHALEQAWEEGCYKVMLLTGRDDTVRFYEQAGFRSDMKTGLVAHPGN
jgi:GNAT superfamily N-acetyltransferase